MSVGSIPHPVARRKPAAWPPAGVSAAPARSVVYLRVRPVPFNRYDSWAAVVAIYESWACSVIGVALDHPEAAVTLAALHLLGARRVELFQ